MISFHGTGSAFWKDLKRALPAEHSEWNIFIKHCFCSNSSLRVISLQSTEQRNLYTFLTLDSETQTCWNLPQCDRFFQTVARWTKSTHQMQFSLKSFSDYASSLGGPKCADCRGEWTGKEIVGHRGAVGFGLLPAVYQMNASCWHCNMCSAGLTWCGMPH